MTIISDTEIRARMAKGELVPTGDPARANECSYSFVAGAAFLAGSKEPPIDFSESGVAVRLVVEPGKMVWVRVQERVRIPKDLVGFWWQTNTLSRKGLMLVNMSMVEPGYEGDLACLFVNFGNGSVLIDARTPIAKMVFVDVRGPVASPYLKRKTRERYDFELNELAIDQPSSFLQIGELAEDLTAQTVDAIGKIKAAGAEVRADAEMALKTARTEAVAGFRDDIPGTVRKSAGWALGAIALVTLASLGSEWFKGNVMPDPKKIARSEAEEVLRDRVSIAGTPNSAETTLLLKRIDELNARLRKVEGGR